MQRTGVFLGFVPWIVFSVVSGPSTWEWAALAGLVCSLILVVPTWRRTHSMSILDAAGIAFFAVMAVLALALDRATLQPLEDRAQLLSSVVIAVVAFGSLAAGRPFTEYYAKQSTPREYWQSPVFTRINRVLTALWGTVFVLNGLCDVAVGFWGADPDLFSWVLPVVLIVAAVKITAWYPDHVTGGHDDEHAAPVAQG
ncbi:hypothetical protein [Actinomycetospora sp. TBRC 11914]|uniref:hypothetical protein n=1 Tax=Actinomycetospora sp. TBRC 11914 TaxID=2729387 RepID=UPI00145E7B6A|nr:hypothetical protein [Actinomycetospora sp. TBRC 11914]NMO90586.1 hypothetical protein [Actinomycetospora sp. TBRC 11914]